MVHSPFKTREKHKVNYRVYPKPHCNTNVLATRWDPVESNGPQPAMHPTLRSASRVHVWEGSDIGLGGLKKKFLTLLNSEASSQ